MMIRGDWRDFRDDPPASRPIYKVALLAVVLFAVAWVVLLVGLARLLL
jgi:hypothetical protein